MANRKISVVITDLDNTLFDWFEVWYRSFKAMLDVIVEISGISCAKLLPEIRAIHRAHGTSEYAFLIEEIPSLRSKHHGANLSELYKEAIDAFRTERKSALRRFHGVKSTLQELRRQGVLIIGYTESMAFYTGYRMRRLELDGLIDFLYSPRDHDLPDGFTKEKIRKYPAEHYEFKKTVHRYTPPNELKPNPKLLLDIVEDIGVDPSQVIYIGDNLHKDVRMAQEAGVVDVHANYGTAHTREEYQLLIDVTHWSDEEVLREQELKKQDVSPTLSLNKNFGQILEWFDFIRFDNGSVSDAEGQTENTLGIAEISKNRLEIWKTIVGVQMHFNDLELRIRNFAILALGAMLSVTGIALGSGRNVDMEGLEVPYAALLLIVGVVVWMAFWFMDRHWYHRLLLGSVRHGLVVEKSLKNILPEAQLTESIKRESPNNFLGREIRSHHRLNLFYWVVAGILIIAATALINSAYIVWMLASQLGLLIAYLFCWTQPMAPPD